MAQPPCIGMSWTALTSIGGFDLGFQYVESSILNAVAQQELLIAGKMLQCGPELQDELIVRFQCRSRLTYVGSFIQK